METETLIVRKNGSICTLELNRPEKRNSLTVELLLAVAETMEALAEDDSVRVVIIRGAGNRAFSSGFDISALPSGPDENPELLQKSMVHQPLTHAFNSIVNYPFPVIAMLNGSAFGAGCELALCADIRIAARRISMGMPPAKIGLVYSAQGLNRFIECIGMRNTKEIFFTGDTYSGERLREIGLADYLVPREELASFTLEMAEKISRNAPNSLKGIKKIINMLTANGRMTPDEAATAEAIVANAYCSRDFREGQRAFLERRKPSFTGE